MAKTNFSPRRDNGTRSKGITSSRLGPSRIPLGFEYELPFNYKLPKGVTGGANFTLKEVLDKL
jgi:hypothetical protein